MTVDYRIGDTRDVTATMPDGSIDLVLTSPPFLALRSYLPADHPDKHREIGSEATPAAFIDMLLELTAEWRRVLAPHGSICVELGDTFSGSGGHGGDYADGGLRDGQPKRHHWTKDRREARAWRTAAAWAGIAAQLGELPACYVTVHLPVPDRRRRDPSNYTKTVKPIVDGLVDAGLWPDDTPEFVTVIEPVLAYRPTSPRGMAGVAVGDVLIELRAREVRS